MQQFVLITDWNTEFYKACLKIEERLIQLFPRASNVTLYRDIETGSRKLGLTSHRLCVYGNVFSIMLPSSLDCPSPDLTVWRKLLWRPVDRSSAIVGSLQPWSTQECQIVDACVCMYVMNIIHPRTCCVDANLNLTCLVIDAFCGKKRDVIRICLHQLDKTHDLLKECEGLLQ